MKGKYEITISYSWGDEEPPIRGFDTKEDAFGKACELAGTEAFVQNEEFDPGKTCTIAVNAAELCVDLHYDSDDTWCYYRVREQDDSQGA